MKDFVYLASPGKLGMISFSYEGIGLKIKRKWKILSWGGRRVTEWRELCILKDVGGMLVVRFQALQYQGHEVKSDPIL